MDWHTYIDNIKEKNMPELKEATSVDEALKIIKDMMLLFNMAKDVAKKQGEYDEFEKEMWEIVPEAIDIFIKLLNKEAKEKGLPEW